MKLRQKLAIVLASAMVAASFPAATMAATTSWLDSYSTLINGDVLAYQGSNLVGSSYNNTTTSPALELAMRNTSTRISAGTQFGIQPTGLSFNSVLYSDIAPRGTSGEVFEVTGRTYKSYVPASTVSGATDNVTVYFNGNSVYAIDDGGSTIRLANGSVVTWDSFISSSIYSSLDARDFVTNFTIAQQGSSYLLVTIARHFESSDYLYFPLAAVITSSSPSLIVSGSGGITNAELTLSTSDLSSYTTNIEIGYTGQISTYAEGNTGSIRFIENKAGAFQTSGDSYAGKNYLLDLRSSKVEWDLREGDVLYVGTDHSLYDALRYDVINNGYHVNFYGGMAIDRDSMLVQVVAIDDEEMIINIHQDNYNNYRTLTGYVELYNLPIDLASRNDELSLGELQIDITEMLYYDGYATYYDDRYGSYSDYDVDDFSSARTVSERLTLANVVDEAVVVGVSDEIEIYAGRGTETIEIVLGELLPDTFNTRYPFYFSLSDGYFADYDDISIDIAYNGHTLSSGYTEDIFDGSSSSEIVFDIGELVDVLENRGWLPSTSSSDYSNYDDILHGILANLSFEVEVGTNIGDGACDIYLEVESRNLAEDLEIYIGESIMPFKYSYEPVNVELGVKGQVTAGEIIITEAEEEMFEEGSKIYIKLEDLGSGNQLSGHSVSADSDSGLEISSTISSGVLVITIDEESDDGPGTITITDLQFDIWGGTPRGDYDLYIGGSAIDQANDDNTDDAFSEKLTVSDFFVVGSDIYQHQVESTINFNTGVAEVNGEEVDMFAVPFLSASGRTMVGVRDIATFFSIHEDNILFTSGGHVTIVNGSDIITLTNGSSILYVNGQPIYMDEEMQIIDGRSYAPARYIAVALGISFDWDDTNRIATFYN